MEKFEIKLYNIDKPNSNGRIYTREVLDKALENLEKSPIFLFDSMPQDFDSALGADHIIGRCISKRWEDDRTLIQTFEMFKKLLISDMRIAPFGTGNLVYKSSDDTYLVEDLKINGFALCDSCAWRSSVKKI